jgi:wyosine [tRNA(Phe)-imidazoG37] synthetase (radical SAM superfamily)
MCAVYAPFWKGTYNLYDRLSEFIGETTPDIITVQGGEVLIQKKTMNFLLDQKNKNTTMRFNLITNGNVKGKIIEKAKKLFTAMTISIVGFQEQTYKTIMSLDIDTVKHFAEEIIKNSNIEINLKFLVTPLNIHEMCLFLDWALPLRPKSVQLVNADIAGYINVSTPISYWNVVFSHTGKELMSYLRNNQQQFSAHTIRLYYSRSLFRLLKIKLDDLNEMKFAGLLLPAG